MAPVKQDLLAFLAQQEELAQSALLDLKDQRVFLVFLAISVQLVLLVCLEVLECQELMDHMARLDLQERLAQPVFLVLLVATQEHLDLLVSPESTGHLAHQDRLALLVLQAQQDLQDPQVLKEYPVPMANQE